MIKISYLCAKDGTTMQKWNTLCKDVLEKKTKEAGEQEYQELIYNHFRLLLGWHCERVEKQYKLRVGSSINYVYPDIVFFNKETPAFVIEMKKPNHLQNRDEVVQLHSYMKLLPVQFGLYIGEHVELYYYEFGKEPISVFQINFTIDSPKGKTFVDLFNQENFSIMELASFCKAQIEKLEQEKEIKRYINDFVTENGKETLSNLLELHLLSEGYSENNAKRIISELEINVGLKHKHQAISTEEHTSYKTRKTEKRSKKDYTHYTLNGRGHYGKGRLALAIVKLFVENNPHLTFSEIHKQIPLDTMSYSAIQSWKESTNDMKKDNRWFESQEDLMKSSDGILFAFTREIGKSNINKIIDFGRKQGYKIEPVLITQQVL